MAYLSFPIIQNSTDNHVGKILPCNRRRQRRISYVPIPRPPQPGDKPCLDLTPPKQPQGIIGTIKSWFIDTKKEEIKKQLRGFLNNALSNDNLEIINNSLLSSQLNALKTDPTFLDRLASILEQYKTGSNSNASITQLLRTGNSFDKIFNEMVQYSNNHTDTNGNPEHFYQLGGYLNDKKGLMRTLLLFRRLDKYCVN